MSFLPEPFFSSLISLCAEFGHGVGGSVCLKWHYVSLSSWMNAPRIISLALSCITEGCTPSCWKRRYDASWTSLFSFIGNKCDQPKLVANICAHLLLLLDTVVANNVSLYLLCGYLLYCNWWSSVLNCLDKDRWNNVWTPCCVVWQIVLSAFLGEIPHFLTRTKWLSLDTFSVFICAICNDDVMTKVSNIVA